MSDEFKFFTAEEVASLTGMSEKWLWAQCKAGAIPHHRLGRRVRFTHDDMRALVAQTAVAVTAQPDDDMVPAGRGPRRSR